MEVDLLKSLKMLLNLPQVTGWSKKNSTHFSWTQKPKASSVRKKDDGRKKRIKQKRERKKKQVRDKREGRKLRGKIRARSTRG